MEASPWRVEEAARRREERERRSPSVPLQNHWSVRRESVGCDEAPREDYVALGATTPFGMRVAPVECLQRRPPESPYSRRRSVSPQVHHVVSVGDTGTIGVEFSPEQIADAEVRHGVSPGMATPPQYSEWDQLDVEVGGGGGGAAPQQAAHTMRSVPPTPPRAFSRGRTGTASLAVENRDLRRKVHELTQRVIELQGVIEWQSGEMSKFRDTV